MEYSFTVKHIKGSSNNTADSLSRLPVVTPGTVSAPFPLLQDTSSMDLPLGIKSAAVNKVEAEVVYDVKHLAFNPNSNIAPCTVSQVVGDSSNVAAWDLVPLSIKEVAAATQTCKVYGKLYKAVKSGIFDKKGQGYIKVSWSI
ncbi:unnamed protein product [Meganyctiphanes norvegica]|uniref:Uncharacterized protein n=1 Tax=Meganyctiphanes norvegica TaxID=48144 RepID=A0AAV2PU08_MEGNR